MNTLSSKIYHLKPNAGFTIIELIVATGIIVLLTSIMTVSFRGLRSTQEIKAAQADTISKLREIQGFILAGKIVPGQLQAADAYVITFTANSNSYLIEVDINGTLSTLETVRYSQVASGVNLSTLTVNGTSVGSAAVRIIAPYGAVLVNGAADQILEMKLSHTASGLTRTVAIDGISGRIGTQATATPPPPNQAPTVNAGSDQIVIQPDPASLLGAASDDGLPPGSTLTTTWSQISGPGTVSFGNPSSLSTTASFSSAGIYVLRLRASDGSLSVTDDVTVSVDPPYDFAVSNLDGDQNVVQGSSVNNRIAVNTIGNTVKPIAVSVSGIPPNATVTGDLAISQTCSSASCNYVLTIVTQSTTPRGNHTITVTGTGSGRTHSTSFTLAVYEPFNFSVSNNGNITVVQGSSGFNTSTATLVAGLSQAVNFSASNLPTGATASFSIPSCNPTCSSTLTVNVSGTTAIGSRTITVTGTDGTLTKTTVFTLTVTPPPPTLISAASTGLTTAQITWRDNSGTETNNAIERGPTGGACSAFINAATLGARSGATYTDGDPTVLAAETLYCYRIRTDWGGGTSNYSGTAVVRTWLRTPTNFNAVNSGNKKITVSWTDNSSVETGYQIERCQGTGCTNFVLVQTTSANATSWTNPGLSNATDYCYRVRATSAQSNSAYSPVKCANSG